MLAAIRIGAVVIPATTRLMSDDIEDRINRGAVRHMVARAARRRRTPEHQLRAFLESVRSRKRSGWGQTPV
jgi:acetyl-CoA synthetase